MPRIVAVMSVYEEHALLTRAVRSLQDGGISDIHVFDGAWGDFSGDRECGASRDGTVSLAEELGCRIHTRYRPWESQEAKRTAMFHACGAHNGDHVLVFDADEEFEGTLAPEDLEPFAHHCLMVRCVVPNDMPGIRSEWPEGDYYAGYKPELRIFAWMPELRCAWPGGYWDRFGRIEPYVGEGVDTASALPMPFGASFLHHGNDRTPERQARKVDYY